MIAGKAFSGLRGRTVTLEERLGMPEARIPLAQAAIYVACAPKSNAAMPVKAGACVDCGACETRCPYNLPIRDMLKKCAEEFGE